MASIRAACLVAGIWSTCSFAIALADSELSPPQHAHPDLAARDVTTVYTYITHTEAVNPEVTVTSYAYHASNWITTVTKVITDSCTQYSYPDLKLGRAEPTTTIVTADTTVTVTRTDVPECTRVSYEAVEYITFTTPYVYTSTHCINTLVRDYSTLTTVTSTVTSYGDYTRATLTETCFTTIFPPIPYTPTTPSTTYTSAPDPFLTTTLATTTVYTTAVTYVTISTNDTSTVSTTECDNPTVRTTQTYFTRTITPTSWVTAVVTTCKTTTTANLCPSSVKVRAIPRENSDEEMIDYVVTRQDSEVAVTTPITTPVVMVQTFTIINMVGATVTATTTTTQTHVVCSYPTP